MKTAKLTEFIRPLRQIQLYQLVSFISLDMVTSRAQQVSHPARRPSQHLCGLHNGHVLQSLLFPASAPVRLPHLHTHVHNKNRPVEAAPTVRTSKSHSRALTPLSIISKLPRPNDTMTVSTKTSPTWQHPRFELRPWLRPSTSLCQWTL